MPENEEPKNEQPEDESPEDVYEPYARQADPSEQPLVKKRRRRRRHGDRAPRIYWQLVLRRKMRARRVRARRGHLRAAARRRWPSSPGPVHRRARLSGRGFRPRHVEDAGGLRPDLADAERSGSLNWRRVAMVVAVLVVLELAVLGAVTLLLVTVCSMTHCVNVMVAPQRPSVRSMTGPVTVEAVAGSVSASLAVAVTPDLSGDSVRDSVIGVWGDGVAPGRVTERAVNAVAARSSLRLQAPSVVTVALSPVMAAAVTGAARRSSVTPEEFDPGQAQDLPTVVANATNWLRGMSLGLAILFGTVAGIRWLFAREPADVDRARSSLAAACAGFAIALLAPQIMSILREILGVG